MSNRGLPLIDRFEQKFVKSDGCWLWTATKQRGYGAIRGKNASESMIPAHRLSYELYVGKIPDGYFVCHKCDVRACVNPDHLFLGTPQDNVDDMLSKGRHHAPRGDAHHAAKLTSEQVRAIQADARTQAEIAKDYGVCQSHVSDLKTARRRGAAGYRSKF